MRCLQIYTRKKVDIYRTYTSENVQENTQGELIFVGTVNDSVATDYRENYRENCPEKLITVGMPPALSL